MSFFIRVVSVGGREYEEGVFGDLDSAVSRLRSHLQVRRENSDPWKEAKVLEVVHDEGEYHPRIKIDCLIARILDEFASRGPRSGCLGPLSAEYGLLNFPPDKKGMVEMEIRCSHCLARLINDLQSESRIRSNKQQNALKAIQRALKKAGIIVSPQLYSGCPVRVEVDLEFSRTFPS